MDVPKKYDDLQNVGDSFANGSSKKILYFSDGTLEVENDNQDTPDSTSESKSLPVNLQKANWFPWMWYQTIAAGSKALELCDYVGESLASFFGITTPKYQFEINEYMRLQKEESQNEMELKSWTNLNDCDNV